MMPARNVFERTIKGQATNVAIMVMVDCSGSMSGAKMRVARQSLHCIGNAFTNLESLGLKWGAYGFTTRRCRKAYYSKADRVCGLEHYKFKGFDENWRMKDVAARTYSSLNLRNNCDSDSLRWAIDALLRVKADRHILIVLSDGQPCFPGNNEGLTALKATVEGARKAGVEVGSIGICTDDPKAFYGENTPVVNDPKELPKALMDQAREWLLG